MTVLTVGQGQQFATISAAVAASGSGDTINVAAGTYANDFPTINHDLTLQAVGGAAVMVATASPPNGKGIIDAGGPGVNVTINGFDISGAVVPDGNGAGIRYEGGNLTLNGDTIHGNQDGLLSNPDPAGTITINGSTFFGNGTGDGGTHDIYVGAIANLTVDSSTITGAVVGHEIKSRAFSTTIRNSVIGDGASGTSSYDIDLPNGGNAVITGNTIEKGANAQNPNAISFGEEGGVYAGSSLEVTGNTMVNHYTAHYTTAVVNDTGATATVSGNQFYGWNTLASGPANLTGNTVLTSEPTLPAALSTTAPTTAGTSTPPQDTPVTTGTDTTGTSAPPQDTPAPVSPVTIGTAADSPGFVAGETGGSPPRDPAQPVANPQTSPGTTPAQILEAIHQWYDHRFPTGSVPSWHDLLAQQGGDWPASTFGQQDASGSSLYGPLIPT